MPLTPSASYSLTIRLRLHNSPGMLGEVTSAIGRAGGQIGAIDIVDAGDTSVVRDIRVDARDRDHWSDIMDAVKGVEGIELIEVQDRTFRLHLGGKITQRNKHRLETRDEVVRATRLGRPAAGRLRGARRVRRDAVGCPGRRSPD